MKRRPVPEKRAVPKSLNAEELRPLLAFRAAEGAYRAFFVQALCHELVAIFGTPFRAAVAMSVSVEGKKRWIKPTAAHQWVRQGLKGIPSRYFIAHDGNGPRKSMRLCGSERMLFVAFSVLHKLGREVPIAVVSRLSQPDAYEMVMASQSIPEKVDQVSRELIPATDS